MSDKNLIKKEIKIFRKDKFSYQDDLMISEKALTLFINGYEFLTMMVLKENLDELIYGFLAAEGIIKNFSDLIKIEYKQNKSVALIELKANFHPNNYKKRTLTSGCGSSTSFINLRDCAEAKIIENSQKYSAEIFTDLMDYLQHNSKYFKKTGGTHTAALAAGAKILYQMEDIGRHNALDKVIGKALLNKIKLEDKIILSSGRISSEMIIKVLKQRIPFLVSRSAPTDAAVKIAEARNLTLIAFCRGKRFNIYSGEERVVL